MIAINCLASSSGGNCYLVTINKDTYSRSINLLLECGLPYQKIVKKLMLIGKSITDVDAVLVTHGHNDHARAVKELRKRGKRVYSGKETLGTENDFTLYPGTVKTIARDVFVTPFSVEHDFDGSLGFIIKAGKEYLLFINDCKYIKFDLSAYKFDYVMIECNYDSQIVHIAYNNAKKEKSPEQYRYKRLLDSHMSNTNCLRTLKTFDLSKCKAIFLMHLSDGHANEQKFKKEIQDELKIPVYICGKFGGIT